MHLFRVPISANKKWQDSETILIFYRWFWNLMNQLSGSVPTIPGKLHFFYLNSKCPPFCISLLFSLINSLSIRSKSWQLTLELLRCARFVSPVNVLVGNRNRKVFRSFSNKRFFFKKTLLSNFTPWYHTFMVFARRIQS